jgi:mono/diheme cytochrome c family protein
MRTAVLLAGAALVVTCAVVPPAPDPQEQLVERGREIFFHETFAGNGRTCGTCHPAENNLTIDPAFIAALPPNDPLFVAEFVPALKENFEKPELMRKFGLILENLDGFEDLARRFVLRGVPHTLGLRKSVDSTAGPRTGWSGDGAPGDGSLRSFAVGAVIQHFTKTLDRVADVDFRLPTEEELDALEAFMLSLGRQEDLALPLPLRGEVPRRGQEIFLDDSLGKCNRCHGNAGANASFGGGNLNFDTGVEQLPDQPADLAGAPIPPDDGLGTPGDGTFNTPPLVEAADTGPFFHNNSVETIEGAVAFYNGQAFNGSPAGQALAAADPNGVGIRLDATQVVAVAAFLRVINALDNIREAAAQIEASLQKRPRLPPADLLRRAAEETGDAIRVLEGGGLHPRAAGLLREARTLIEDAACGRPTLARRALDTLKEARADLAGGLE